MPWLPTAVLAVLWLAGVLVALFAPEDVLDVVGLAFAALTLNHGGDVRLAAFGTSRVQLAPFGMAFPLAGAVTLVLAAFTVRRLLGR